jgi:hypothetical protein
MAFFAPIIGAAISGGLGLLGQSRAEKAQRRAQEQAIAANQPRNVTGPFGFSRIGPGGGLTLGLSPELQSTLGQIQAGQGNFAGSLTDPNFVQNEVERLRAIAAPRENALRSSLRSRLFNRGRLGLGTTGALSGQIVDLANAQSQVMGLPNQLANLSFGARTPASLAAGYQDIGRQQARFNESFFGSLGSALSPAIGGLFGGGGSVGGGASGMLGRAGFF